MLFQDHKNNIFILLKNTNITSKQLYKTIYKFFL